MASYLSGKLGVHVSIMGIKMRPSSTKIYRFKIGNPPGSKTSNAFTVKTIELNYVIQRLFGEPSVIDQLKMNDIFIGVELYNPLGTDNNWTRITANLAKDQDEKEGHEVLIKKLILENIDIEIKGLGIKGVLGLNQKKHIDHLEFSNISSKKGFPTKELIRAIFGQTGLQEYIKNLLNPKSYIKDVFSPFSQGQSGELKDLKEST